MLKKILLPAMLYLTLASAALAAVEVNKADQAALDSVAGVGPATSKAIIAERDKHGSFRDWADFERRVQGVGTRNAVKLSAAGLTVNGKSYQGSTATTSGKPAKVDTKAADKAAAGKP